MPARIRESSTITIKKDLSAPCRSSSHTPQGYRIGGLLGLAGGGPTEVALVVGVEVNLRIGGNGMRGTGAGRQQGLGVPLKLFEPLPPGDAAALGGANEQTPRLSEQQLAQGLHRQPPIDQQAQGMIRFQPVGRRRSCGQGRGDRPRMGKPVLSRPTKGDGRSEGVPDGMHGRSHPNPRTILQHHLHTSST